MAHYEFIEHTADIVIRAFGDTLEEAFAGAATARFDILTEKAPIKREQKVPLEAESIDLQGLLVTFLSQLLVVHEVDRLVLSDFEVSFGGGCSLKAVGWGEPFDEARHGGGLDVKAVTYHMMEVFDGHGERPSFVQVLFDV